MSKESYARGFVKAAAAAGVDPTGLAKFAQEFKTDGWAPRVVAILGNNKPIKYYPPTLKSPEYARTMDKDDRSIRFSDANADHPARLKPIDVPGHEIFVNWLRAHQKARQGVAKGGDYHDLMAKGTGVVSRVSAPEKK